MPAYNQSVVSSGSVPDSVTEIAEVPSAKCWRIVSIIFLNYSLSGTPTTETFSLYIGGNTDEYLVKQLVTLNPGQDYVFSEPLLLPAGTAIYAIASTNSKITVTVNAVEMHAP